MYTVTVTQHGGPFTAHETPQEEELPFMNAKFKRMIQELESREEVQTWQDPDVPLDYKCGKHPPPRSRGGADFSDFGNE